MENLKAILADLMIDNLENNKEKNKSSLLWAWALKNNRIEWEKSSAQMGSLKNFWEGQISKGYSTNDMDISAWVNDCPVIEIRNKLNGAYFHVSLSYQVCPLRENLLKSEILEAEKPYFDLVAENRKKYLGNETACREFIEKGNFYQNNFEKMAVDQETHDFILATSKKLEQEKQAEKEKAKEKLKKWAMENGSPLLQKRIQHGHNWPTMAIGEYAFSRLPNFTDDPYGKGYLVIESYEVKNGTLGQLEILEKAQIEYPGIGFDIVRFKYSNEGENIYYTYLRANVPSIMGNTYLYKEITDAGDIV